MLLAQKLPDGWTISDCAFSACERYAARKYLQNQIVLAATAKGRFWDIEDRARFLIAAPGLDTDEEGTNECERTLSMVFKVMRASAGSTITFKEV